MGQFVIMKTIIIFLFVFAFNTLYACGQQFPLLDNGPEEFRGFPLEASLEEVKDKLIYKDGRPLICVKLYTRKDDELTFGNAKLESVEYLFFKDKLLSIDIKVKGIDNYNYLKDAVCEKYGKGYEYLLKNSYIYPYKNITMTLIYFNNEGTFTISNENTSRLVKEWLEGIKRLHEQDKQNKQNRKDPVSSTSP
jgi:hypothetical protein